jgi:hypothetical protein
MRVVQAPIELGDAAAAFLFLLDASITFFCPSYPRHLTTTPTILILLTVSRVWRWVAVMVVGLAVGFLFARPPFLAVP